MAQFGQTNTFKGGPMQDTTQPQPPRAIGQPASADDQHPGWNYGESGPPGSPDFVRHPKTQQDWENR